MAALVSPRFWASAKSRSPKAMVYLSVQAGGRSPCGLSPDGPRKPAQGTVIPLGFQGLVGLCSASALRWVYRRGGPGAASAPSAP